MLLNIKQLVGVGLQVIHKTINDLNILEEKIGTKVNISLPKKDTFLLPITVYKKEKNNDLSNSNGDVYDYIPCILNKEYSYKYTEPNLIEITFNEVGIYTVSYLEEK